MNRRRFACALLCLPALRGASAQAQPIDAGQSAEPPLAQAQSFGAIAPSSTSAGMVAPASTAAGELMFRALSLIGVRYRPGGNSPESGFDCSGFVSYLFREVMNIRLPRSADQIWQQGSEVAFETLEPGDLVFYNTLRRPFSHVGVYVGEGRFVHAPASGGMVRTESMHERYWARRWNGAKRIAA